MAISAQQALGFNLLETGLNGNFEEAMTLLNNGADPAFSDLRGNNFLHIARFRNHRDFYDGVTAYLNEHAETDDYETNLNLDRHEFSAIRMGEKPLYEIARTPDQLRGVVETVNDIWLGRAERRREEDLNVKDYRNNNDTLLHRAARAGSYEAMRHLILERGAETFHTNNDNKVFLDLIPEDEANLKNAIKEILNGLFMKAAEADYTTEDDADIKVKECVDSGVDLDCTCLLTGRTVLHKAAVKKNIKFLTSLLRWLPKGSSTDELIDKKDTVGGKEFLSYLERDEYYTVMEAAMSSGHLGYSARSSYRSSRSGYAVGNLACATASGVGRAFQALRPLIELAGTVVTIAETINKINSDDTGPTS